MSRVQILIVDDHPLFRRGIRWSLESEHDLLVVGEAPDGPAAIQQADLLVPDVVLIDINMPQMSGLEVARILKRRHPQLGIIILTMHEDDEQLFHAIRVGAASSTTSTARMPDPGAIVSRHERKRCSAGSPHSAAMAAPAASVSAATCALPLPARAMADSSTSSCPGPTPSVDVVIPCSRTAPTRPPSESGSVTPTSAWPSLTSSTRTSAPTSSRRRRNRGIQSRCPRFL